MNNHDSMQEQMMMMKEMSMHHTMMYTFDVLVLVGLATIIVLLRKILKTRRR